MQKGRPTKRERPPFGERIAAARERLGLSQSELAERVGVSQKVIGYWERHSVALRTEQLTALAKALNVSAEELVGEARPKARGNGPVGKGRRLFEAISQMPRHQQEKIFSVVELFVTQNQSKTA